MQRAHLLIRAFNIWYIYQCDVNYVYIYIYTYICMYTYSKRERERERERERASGTRERERERERASGFYYSDLSENSKDPDWGLNLTVILSVSCFHKILLPSSVFNKALTLDVRTCMCPYKENIQPLILGYCVLYGLSLRVINVRSSLPESPIKRIGWAFCAGPVIRPHARERERERESKRTRDRARQTDRQTGRQMERLVPKIPCGLISCRTESRTERETERQRPSERETAREIPQASKQEKGRERERGRREGRGAVGEGWREVER